MRITLIRHGETPGNARKNFIGRTDEHLSGSGKEQIVLFSSEGKYPAADKLFVSPLKRCIETAGIIYPETVYTVVPEFREMDFGLFEGKNHSDLKDNQEYRNWIKSNGLAQTPEGESVSDFCERVIKGFAEVLKTASSEKISIVAHGGTIMAILSFLTGKNMYDFITENGCGYTFDLSGYTFDLSERKFVMNSLEKI